MKGEGVGGAGPLTVTGVPGLPEIGPGADLAGMISDAAPDLRDGDIVVVTSKIVSKAEGRVIRADRERAIDAEAVRVVARRGQTRIVETRHGLVLAAAGVDFLQHRAGHGGAAAGGPGRLGPAAAQGAAASGAASTSAS